MNEYEEGDVIDPIKDDLDPDTLRAVQHLLRGYSETSPSKPPSELTDYRKGRHNAFSAMMAVISSWLEDIEADSDGEWGDNVPDSRE